MIIEHGKSMVWTVIGIIFACMGASCAAIGSILVQREIAAVNRKMPAAEQISSSFMYPGKMYKIKTAYGNLYPPGSLNLGVWVFRSRCLLSLF